MYLSSLTGDTTWDIVTYIASAIVVFITGGGLAKLIKEIRKGGKKVNLKELIKETKKQLHLVKKLKKVIDDEGDKHDRYKK